MLFSVTSEKVCEEECRISKNLEVPRYPSRWLFWIMSCDQRELSRNISSLKARDSSEKACLFLKLWLVPCRLIGSAVRCQEICRPIWRHQMETFFTLLALCEGNPLVTGGFPSQRPVTRSFDVFFDLRLNKLLSKKSRRRWFETPSRSLWLHCYDYIDNQLQVPYVYEPRLDQVSKDWLCFIHLR